MTHPSLILARFPYPPGAGMPPRAVLRLWQTLHGSACRVTSRQCLDGGPLIGATTTHQQKTSPDFRYGNDSIAWHRGF